MTTVLITGGNGHIGANTVRESLDRGYKVVAMVREGADLQGLEGLDIEIRHGDVLDRESMIKAAEGCDAIIHLATVYRLWAKDAQEILEPALAGTRYILEAAKEHRVSRLVYCSSAAAVGGKGGSLSTPDNWHDDAQNPYYQAKTLAERQAWELAEQYGVSMIAMCPSVVLGRYDYKITPSTGFIRDLVNGSATTYNGGGNYVDVREVAMVHAMAVEKGEPGKRYLVGGENVMIPDVGKIVHELTGIKPGHNSAPRFAALMVGSVLEAGARITGKMPAYTRSVVYELIESVKHLDCSATYKTFGYQPRPARESIAACIDWLLEIDAVKPKAVEKIRAHRAM